MALRSILVAGLIALGAASASAQTRSEEPNVIESLIVRGRLPGPPWWRVSTPTSTLYILVLPEMTPRGMAWDKTILERRMTGANLLITPAVVEDGAVDRILSTAQPKEVQSQLSRVQTAWRQLGAGPLFLPTNTPAKELWIATGLFETNYLDSRSLVGGDIERLVRASARAHKVRTVSAGEIEWVLRASATGQKLKAPSAGQVTYNDLKAGLPLDADQVKACVDRTLADPPAVAAAYRKAAMDWANGDVRGLLTAPPSFLTCAMSNGPMFQVAYRKSNEIQVTAFEAALRVPGKSVAIVRAGWLLREDGSLDQLKAKGYQVDTPGRLED